MLIHFKLKKNLANSGLNIYDASVWALGLAALGEFKDFDNYLASVLRPGSTCQFNDIKADAPCRGTIYNHQCADTSGNGSCGFCYGDSGDQTLNRPHSWFFRMISDMYSRNELDERCPERGVMWGWNDYRPVLGENAWTNLILPLQVAYMKYGGTSRIPQNSVELSFALDFVLSLQKMYIIQIFAFYYAPHNTYSQDGTAEFQVSTENNVSLLAGLKMLLQVLQTLNIYPTEQGIISTFINDILIFLRSAYRSDLGYFDQGLMYYAQNHSISWNKGFAVDCQTWTISVVGARTIDTWFGPGTTLKIWERTKQLSGYKYNERTHDVEGVGFSEDRKEEIFSGEWTFGAINALKVAATHYTGSSAAKLNEEIEIMRNSIERELTKGVNFNGCNNCPGVLYANKRHYIPFGWWANPVISTASTGWAVLVDKNYNPLNLGGSYVVN